MQNRGTGRMWRAARRGVALGLALVAAWGAGLTVGGGQWGARLTALGGQPDLAVSLLSGQLGWTPGEDRALEGWGRMLLDQSPLLAAGEEAVARLRLVRQEDPPAETDPEEGDGEKKEDFLRQGCRKRKTGTKRNFLREHAEKGARGQEGKIFLRRNAGAGGRGENRKFFAARLPEKEDGDKEKLFAARVPKGGTETRKSFCGFLPEKTGKNK